MLWLLFFPNAPYIITDYVHIDYLGEDLIPWFDFAIITFFALSGLLIALISLKQVVKFIESNLFVNRKIFLIPVFILTGYGIYLGRELRWNSWDAITRPFHLANDMVNSLWDWKMWYYVFTFTILLSIIFHLFSLKTQKAQVTK